ncbi:LysR family transcriptional regulator [Vibrio parahaemolyticus]|uniref:LysR family transcriptional regulator n=1 Tax=Vibrio parahaemolyticus TaxID=670 RepID=UPI000410C507|nr:LysR family transcriptional regulator [Vibrio parahaemolyticus]EHK4784811.1 LysR family transcriptional regulator [Vibrio parahaemolyticus]EIJ0974862.1 LysR family transcriptional regulator [Vibrio parahaemolyticus]EIJ0976430.1 LysR family transcriptional regulator [Vibrio parahaemolyticus]EJO4008108.1 LysR family transcriptional regulator [Vibrio parahaemolyticus]MBM4989214.1 LysR family transcriptional regulator [Vibrio parahaemolyticus]
MRFTLDFNLLKTLIVLAEKQNLKKAGIVLGLTESAVSKQITRLREQLNDDLFVRMSGKLVPTDYTVSILPKVKMAFSDLEEAITTETFAPSEYSEPIRIALPDLVMERFGITLYEQLLQAFPKAFITICSWGDDTEEKIAAGSIDFGVHLLNSERSMSVYQQKISDDKLVIATALLHGKYHWNEVKHWPFIKQRAVGWNEQKFEFIEHLHHTGIDLNYAHDIDTVSFALKLMQNQKVANVLPRLVLDEKFTQVEGSEFVSYDIIWASNTRLTDKKSPIYKYLHQLVLNIFK